MEDGKYNRDINCLKDRDKSTRISALGRLLSSLKSESNHSALFQKLKHPLLDLLKDPSDKCKELSVSLLKSFISSNSIPPEDLPLLIQSFHSRLGQDQLIESCEEVRVSSIETLFLLSQNYLRFIHIELSRLTDIIARAARDKFPQIKLLASDFVSFLSQNSEKISLYARKLVEALRLNFFHQQFKVRAAALQAAGDLLRLKQAQGLVADIWMDLKKIQLDKKSEVLEVLNLVVARILQDLDEELRFACEGKLIYTILCCDEKCKDVLNCIGKMRGFEELGCKSLVLGNFDGIVALCLSDLQEWTLQDNYRSRAGGALIRILEITGREALTHVEMILSVVFRAFSYDSAGYLVRAVQILAVNCDFCFMMTVFGKYCYAVNSSNDVASALGLLAVLIGEIGPESIEQAVVWSLLKKMVEVDDPAILRQVHQVSNLLLQKFESQVALQDIFLILLTLDSSEISQEVQHTISKLAEYGGISVEELYSQNLSTLLPSFQSCYKSWYKMCPQVSLFTKLTSRTFYLTEDILQIIIFNSQIEIDTKVRSSMLSILISCIRDQSFSFQILTQVIIPTSAWNDSSPQLRLQSLKLLSYMLAQQFVEPGSLRLAWGQLFPVIKTCGKDDLEGLRMESLCCIQNIVDFYFENLDLIEICDVYPELLVKLDDCSEDIRVLSCKCFCKYFDKVHCKGIRQGNYRYIVEHLFSNLDDSSEVIQKHVQMALASCIKLGSSDFISIAKEVQKTHRHQRAVQELINLASTDPSNTNDYPH